MYFRALTALDSTVSLLPSPQSSSSTSSIFPHQSPITPTLIMLKTIRTITTWKTTFVIACHRATALTDGALLRPTCAITSMRRKARPWVSSFSCDFSMPTATGSYIKHCLLYGAHLMGISYPFLLLSSLAISHEVSFPLKLTSGCYNLIQAHCSTLSDVLLIDII